MASAADLKFLHPSAANSDRNFKSKSGTRIIALLVPPLFPKFVSECAEVYHELRKRGTRVSLAFAIGQFGGGCKAATYRQGKEGRACLTPSFRALQPQAGRAG